MKNKSPLVAIAKTIEWLVVALAFALIFRGFVVEAFKIPTGSMAPTLRGDHFYLSCHQCGEQFDVGYAAGRTNNPQIAKYCKCPSCGNIQRIAQDKIGGDRILVLKSIYQFREPERWDVFVFKNPAEPEINYIKRLIGLPGEEILINDGDIFINGKIARKPQRVLDELWMPIYINDQIPARPSEPTFNSNGAKWKFPFVEEGGQWEYQNKYRTIVGKSSEISQLKYDSTVGNNFGASYAYDAAPSLPGEVCSDLKIEYYAKMTDETKKIGSSIEKYGRIYRGIIDTEKKKMFLVQSYEGKESVLDSLDITAAFPDKPIRYQFNNADYRLQLSFGKYKMEYILGEAVGDIGSKKDGKTPSAAILVSGEASFSHISINRDIHYTTYAVNRGDKPFELDEDQFFACGDNSPNSADSRLWDTNGIGNNGKVIPVGVVPRDYVSGRAFMVYWPGSLAIKPDSKFRIPNVGKMRLIYGG